MTIEDEIEEVLSGPELDTSDPPAQPSATEDRQAMFMMRRLARLRAERQRVEQLYTDVLDELELRRRSQLDPIEATIDWLEQALALWHHARLQENPKALTVHLPTGTLVSSKAQPRWTYDDAAAFLEWATTHAADLVRRPEPKDEIDKNAVKKWLSDDKVYEIRDDGRVVIKEGGEFVPGVRVSPGGDFDLGRFYRVET
jgi:phage host-nuclease inhibitor protein Gam